MLQIHAPTGVTLEGARFLPPVLAPLIAAAERGEHLEAVVSAIVRMFGFDTFVYGASLSPRPGQEAIGYIFTTAPREWVVRYDQRAYIEVDPRVLYSFDSAMPFIWDQESERGKSAATDAFLDDAAAHGVASGVAFAIHATPQGQVLVGFNSAQRELCDLRRLEVARNLGDMYLFGIYFHEVFMKTVVSRGLPPRLQGAPLSPQEKRCLLFSAHGYTSRFIAATLGISERTVELHFAHVRSKLGVANRQEAIAKAIADGLIRRGQLPSESKVMSLRRGGAAARGAVNRGRARGNAH
jgi:LuxR family transcriptional activator of bioluminescence operon